MNSFSSKLNEFLKNNLTKHTIVKSVLFLIPLISMVLKGIFVQGFLTSKNPYNFNFFAGYNSTNACLTYYIAFTLVLLSFSLLFKGRGMVIYIFIVDIITTFLVLLDVWYFRGFQTMPSALLLSQTSNLDNMTGSIMSMISSYDYLFILDLIILPIYVFFTRKSYVKNINRSPKTFLCVFIVALIYIVYVPFNINVLHNKNVKNSYFFDNYDPTSTTRYLSPVGYHIIDAYTVYRDSKPYKLTTEDMTDINKYFETKKENLPDNEYFGAAKGKNLIYIQVESLENFVIGQKINGQEITPNLNKLLNNSLYFPNTFEQVNEGTSADCDFMTNTSLLPLRRGCTFFRYPNNDYASMPKILAKNGYNTTVIHPDKGSFWNYQLALSGGIGFQKFTDYYSFNHDEEIGMGISDRSYFEQVTPMLKQEPQPFYGMTVTLTSHGPFDLPAQYRKLGLDPELDKNKLGGYFESIHYTDEQLGHFLDLLNQEGILQNSIIAIMGDHTGVHKYYDDDIDQLSTKQDWFLDNGNHTVPIIIYDPSSTIKAKSFDKLYNGEIDLMPTLLYLLGVPKDQYENSVMGRNLLNTERSFAIITDGTLKGGENLTDEQKAIYKKSLDISDKMIRANYVHK